MILRDELSLYLHKLLACDNFNDYAPNGLQIEGSAELRRICTAVSASAESIEQAVEFQADALLVHHGYFWRGEASVLTGMKRARIAKLIGHELSLFSYHLPLDCHAELGNNACLAKRFELELVAKHKAGNTADLLWSGSFLKAKSVDELSGFLQKKLNREPLCIVAGDKPIKRIAWCSGAAQDFIEEAQALGVDAYLSGEISERTYYQAKELGIHYFACGHHATERYGIQALGEHLADKFDLHHQFIDSFNPV